jgi:hypothetical protein
MGKKKTTLINATQKPLELYEEASNGSQRRISVLQPSGDKQTAEDDKQQTVLKTNRNTGKTKIEGISPSFYVHSVDPNDSYSTLRLWSDKQAVVGLSTDEMLDSKTITIIYEKGVFKKEFEPRTSSDRSSDSTWRNFFKGVWNNIKMHSKQ